MAEALGPWPSLATHRGGAPRVMALTPSPSELAYRTRAKLAVDGAAVGLFSGGAGHRVVDSPGCVILEPAVARSVAALRAIAAGAPTAPSVRAIFSRVRAVDVRGTHPAAEVLVTLVLEGAADERPGPDLRAAAEALLATTPAAGCVAVSFRPAHSARLLGGAPTVLAGRSPVPDQVGDAPLAAIPGAFVQANRGTTGLVQRELLRIARELSRSAGRRLRVLDVYGGSGTWSLPLTGVADVVLVDSVAPAAEGARARGLESIVGDAGVELDALRTRGAVFDLVLVNPPRRGLAPGVRRALADLASELVAYVSCEPTTLARDLADLERLGLRATELRPFDMMPLTAEVETLAVLRRSPIPSLAAVARGVVDKPPHETAAAALARAGLTARTIQELDVDESGLVSVGRPGASSTFLAVVEGVARARGALDRGRARYRRVEVAGGHSLVEAEARGARPLRRALAAVGHPVLGDTKWGDAAANRFFEQRHGLDRVALHRSSLRAAGGAAIAQAPLPPDLVVLLQRLRDEGERRILVGSRA